MSARELAVAAALLSACGGSDAAPQVHAHATGTAPTGEAAPPATGSARELPNRPTFEASARLRPADPEVLASASTPSPSEPIVASCEPSKPPAGYENCEAVEVVGGPPCELECWRERKVATKAPDRCCDAPVHGAIFGKGRLLVEADACAHVDPSCAHTTIKSVEQGFHFFSDSSPREVLLVQGGCEMRAMSHGYVPSGVAAWTGCPVAKRFRWNGTRFTPVPATP